MTTSYTFVNAVAARLFAEWWNEQHAMQVAREDARLMVNPVALASLKLKFQHQAEAFNAASQKAREIGEGDE